MELGRSDRNRGLAKHAISFTKGSGLSRLGNPTAPTHGQLSALYDTVGAARYDSDAAFMPSRYSIASSIEGELALSAIAASSRPSTVLDLGCGTAEIAIQLLGAQGDCRYIGVDASPHMLAIADVKLRRQGFGERSTLIERDAWSYVETRRLIGMPPPQCVLTSMLLHHYPFDERSRLFDAIRGLLSAGGVFILRDLYSSHLPLLAKATHELEMAEIAFAERRLPPGPLTTSEWTTISRRHYASHACPNLEDEVSLLQKLGFDTVDVAYRHGQVAVLIAQAKGYV